MPDVNVLVAAFRSDAPGHEVNRSWLEHAVRGREPIGISELVLSGTVRIVTHPRVFSPPTPIVNALEFADALRAQRAVILLRPGERHWSIFADLCRSADARGNLVADAYHAALAIENGADWITSDRDYARFPGLRWRLPTAR
jgi:toxin-antitoxin system PIN domain toxin